MLSSPVIRCVKNQYPEVEIHYLTKKAFAPVLSANPYIHKIHCLQNDLPALINDLKRESFDLIVDLHRNIRSSIVKKALRIPSAAFPKLNRSKWLLVNFRINILPEVHIVDRYFRAVSKWGVKYDGKGLDYFIPEQDCIDIQEELPEAFHKGYMLVVVGAKHKTKQVPVEKLTEICNTSGFPVVLTGGPEDHEQAVQLADQLKVPVVNMCGRFNVNGSADLVRNAVVVLSPDTGLMHIAAAFRKPLVSVWGNTIPGFGMYPFYPEGQQSSYHIHEVKALSCRPCSKIGFERCPKGHFRCMFDIQSKAVVDSVKTLAGQSEASL